MQLSDQDVTIIYILQCTEASAVTITITQKTKARQRAFD